MRFRRSPRPASIRDLEGVMLANLITSFVRLPRIRVIDLGCGFGHLVSVLEQYPQRFEPLGVDLDTTVQLRCSKGRFLRHDVTAEFPASVAADITTSFEVAEHIPETKQDRFWSNVYSLAPCHLCTINWNRAGYDHVTIRTSAAWQSYLARWFVVDEVKPFPIPWWKESYAYFLRSRS